MNIHSQFAVIARKKASGSLAFENAMTNGNALGYIDSNLRILFDSAALTGSGDDVRVTIECGSLNTLNISEIYIGEKAASGDAYDFDGNQVELLFSGSSGVDLTAGESATSDYASFSFDSANDYIVSIGTDASGHNGEFATGTDSDCTFYSLASGSDQTSATTPTGTYSNVGAFTYGISKIEVK